MKYLLKILFIMMLNQYALADQIDTSGLMCDLDEQESKRAPSKKLIYYFDNGTVYAVQVFKQSSPIKIGKILISEYRYDDKEIKWEGQNASKSIKYYAIVDRLSHVLNIKYVFVSGSKSKNNSENFFYCKFTNWQTIEEFLKPQLEN
jgi:hypothetical protein